MQFFTRLTRQLAGCALMLSAGGMVHADVLTLPAEQPTAQISLPVRGSTMTQVQNRFGEPVQRQQTVGGGHPRRPPITRWNYDAFYVVFENDRVIDSVVPEAPTPIRSESGLRITSETLPAQR